MTISMALDLFLVSCRLRCLSERTIDCYFDFISKFLNCKIVTMVEDLNYDAIEKYILKLLNNNLSQATIATYIRHLKIFIKWLEIEGYITESFSTKIKVPRTPKKIVRIYEDLEIEMIFMAINNNPLWIMYRNCSIVALMIDSGIRQNEVCSIKKDDIQFRESIIKIHGKGNKERLVPIGKFTQHYLSLYMKLCPYNTEYLFNNFKGKKLTRNAVKLLVQKIAKVLPFQFSSHKLRHNFATNYCIDQYEKYGHVDIYKLMVLLGHEDIMTTRRYLHLANQVIASKSNISHIDKILLKRQ